MLSQASLSELLDRYAAGPQQLRQAVLPVSLPQQTARPIEGKWSILEVVAHISDFEPILADRMKRILALDKPPLISANENLYASQLFYHDRDLEEELRLIETTRAQMLRILRKLPPDAYQRVGVHTERGELTLERILTMACNHIPHHLPFLAEKRKALGI